MYVSNSLSQKCCVTNHPQSQWFKKAFISLMSPWVGLLTLAGQCWSCSFPPVPGAWWSGWGDRMTGLAPRGPRSSLLAWACSCAVESRRWKTLCPSRLQPGTGTLFSFSFCCIPLAGASHTDSPAAGVGEADCTFVVRRISHVAKSVDTALSGEL